MQHQYYYTFYSRAAPTLEQVTAVLKSIGIHDAPRSIGAIAAQTPPSLQNQALRLACWMNTSRKTRWQTLQKPKIRRQDIITLDAARTRTTSHDRLPVVRKGGGDTNSAPSLKNRDLAFKRPHATGSQPYAARLHVVGPRADGG